MSECGNFGGAEGGGMALVLGVLEWMGWRDLRLRRRGVYI